MKVHGSGSIVSMEPGKARSKTRRWQLRVSLGKSPKTGRYRQRTRRFDGTYTQAKSALRAFIAEIEGMGAVLPADEVPTVAEAAAEWLEARERSHEVAASSVRSHRYTLNAVCDHIGSVRADKLTRHDVQGMLAAMMDGETRTGTHAGPTYVRGVHAVLSTLYTKHIVPRGYAPSNPCEGVALPKRKRREYRVVDEDGYARLSSWLEPCDSAQKAGIALALLAGLRRGECVRARWRDLEGGRLHVRGTKNAASDAVVPIQAALVDRLAEWKAVQADQLAEWYVEQTGDTPICALPDGTEREMCSISTWWTRHRDALGFEGVRFHDLRHAFVSHCCRLGMNPKHVQRLARHATFAVTMDVYTHVTDGELAESVGILDGFSTPRST